MNISLQKIIDRIAEAFSILDFSYIISGSIAYTLLYWILCITTSNFQTVLSSQPTALLVFVSIMLTYSLGLFVSSGGCWVRSSLGCLNIKYLRDYVNKHIYFDLVNEWNNAAATALLNNQYSPTPAIQKENIEQLLKINDNAEAMRKYTYLWCVLSNNPQAVSRLEFINKFWVMQKIYEGLFLDSFIAIIAVAVMTANNNLMNLYPCILLTLSLFIVCLVFLNEANRCAKNQLHEVISAYITFGK